MSGKTLQHLIGSFVLATFYLADAATPGGWNPTALGEATNGLRAAASIVAVSTNEYNHYTVCLGITNTTDANEFRSWVLPAAERRFAFRILDKKGRPIIQAEFDPPALEPLAANMSLLYFGKNVLGDTDGVMPFLAHQAAPVSKFNLDEYAQMPPPGTYKLEVEERLYQVTPDQRLLPVLFPRVTLDLTVVEQLSETALLLNEEARQGKLCWSKTVDALRIGVQHSEVGEASNENQTQFEVFVENLGREEIRDLRMPRLQEQFDISLTGPDGQEVPRTALGQQRGLPLQIKDSSASLSEFFVDGPRPTGTRAMFAPARDATEIVRFNLLELFEIKKPGKYTLKYQQRFYQMDPTIRPAPVIFPEVVFPLELKEPIDIHTSAPE